MRGALRLLALSMAILALTASTSTAWATHSVSVPNYPTLSQLESGWNAAFVSWLTAKYGGTPTITSTVTYSGQDGQIFVVSSFMAGGISGKILGRAFDPQEGTYLGGGVYQYQVKENGAFKCAPVEHCSDCEAHERHYNDGTYERWCDCVAGGTPSGCSLTPLSSLVGSYLIKAADYGSLPALN